MKLSAFVRFPLPGHRYLHAERRLAGLSLPSPRVIMLLAHMHLTAMSIYPPFFSLPRGRSGHEDGCTNHAARMVAFAREMIRVSQTVAAETGIALQLRIGLASGPAAGGVVGKRCPRYFFYGEPVRVASSLEAAGDAGRIVVCPKSESTVQGNVPSLHAPKAEAKEMALFTDPTFTVVYIVRSHHPSQVSDTLLILLLRSTKFVAAPPRTKI